ncbi:MAG: UvrABC system protein C [Myxococcota bacterium]|nr:UvrABC system protein C [Myxococcota bacterium]
MRPLVEQKLESLPASPGVYLMKGARGEIIYIGKAASLRNRVRSYFNRGGDDRPFVALLDDLLHDIEVILTNTEKEALLLEDSLIKKHRPRFNVDLRDNKSFLCLRMDVKHRWPRVEVTRRIRNDGARYFGPYASAQAVRHTLKLLNRHFQLRTCSDGALTARKRPCLEYHIKRCPAPCVLEVDHGAYMENVRNVLMFLEGRHDELANRLRAEMETASEGLDFERAARLRDQIHDIMRSLEKAATAGTAHASRDIIGFAREAGRAAIVIMGVRNGRLLESRPWLFRNQEFPDEDILSGFLCRYYDSSPDIPDEVLLPMPIEDAEVIASWMGDRRGRKTVILFPQRGDRASLLELARKNALHQLESDGEKAADRIEALGRLQEALRLPKFPSVIECYDISTLGQTLSVGSRVVMRDGEPDSNSYRRYRIKQTDSTGDFAMMYEVLKRRFQRSLEHGEELPDLVVVDGGKGQLNVAREVFRELGIEGVGLAGLAKARVDGLDGDDAPTHSPERVFIPGRKDPIVLRQNSAELLLLARLRDEAHRFAVTYQRKLRKRGLRSALDDIPGVGPRRRAMLLKHFGSVRALRRATLEELQAAPGLPGELAARIHVFLNAREDRPDETVPRPDSEHQP